MTDYKAILRLLAQDMSQRNTALACGVSRNTVANVRQRSSIHQLTWEEAEHLTNSDIQKRLFPEHETEKRDFNFQMPDYNKVHQELSKKHVTLQLLWEEYCEECKASKQRYYQYTQFRKYYHDFTVQEKLTIRIEHKPGALLESDWAGYQPSFIDPVSRQTVKVSLFVCVLPYSQLIYAELFEDQKLESWIEAHVHAFNYFNGAPLVIKPDNLRTGVTYSDWYSPDIQKNYQEMAEYYGSVVIPARVRKPRDKGSVESSVRTAERKILAALRNQQYLSFEDLHQACFEKLEKINSTPMKQDNNSRWSIFHAEEQDFLLPLPTQSFELAYWSKAKVQVNCHISFQKYFYSVPHEYLQCEVDVRSTKRVVEILYKHERIASHQRLWGKQRYSTIEAHMPANKLFFQDWDADRFRHWAQQYGSSTAKVVDSILSSYKVVQQGYNACFGLMALAKKYSAKRLEQACQLICLRTTSPTYRQVKDILARDEDFEAVTLTVGSERKKPPIGHQRGAAYYKKEKE